MRKLIWVKADGVEPWEVRKSFVKTAIESGADAVLVNPGEAAEVGKLGAIMVASREKAPGVGVTVFPVPAPRETEGVLHEIENLRSRGEKVAALIEVKDKETEKVAIGLGKASDFLLVTARDWKIIPLENIIAELQGSGTSILAGVKNAEEAKTVVQTLEIGTAGVLLDIHEAGPDEIKRTCETLEGLTAEKLELIPAKIKTLKAVGMGDRACIDTASIMEPGEGMLVGSQAEGLFLVHSETLPSEFVETRPFRVNAGAVHAYIRIPGGKTKYMSELQAGDEVLLVNTEGKARVGIIGRVKIEKRPLILVEAEREGKTYKTLLQNAETINLVGKGGKPISVTKLRSGDEVLVFIEAGGRHFGIRVEETVIEK